MEAKECDKTELSARRLSRAAKSKRSTEVCKGSTVESRHRTTSNTEAPRKARLDAVSNSSPLHQRSPEGPHSAIKSRSLRDRDLAECGPWRAPLSRRRPPP